ncbi:MAG: hypothetical protein IJU60_02005 [Acholeplasmatales bacterium]|nr:hypothetical protein [Acholeplasmatales bacterium]
MNRVYERSQKESSAKFYYSSQKLFREVKAIKLTLYILSMVPIILSFTPVNEIKIGDTNIDVTFVATMVAFLLNIIAELASSLMTGHKEKAILLNQLYEAEITGSSFSKIEYDRELTNELNELAIRKALAKMARTKKNYHDPKVPENISDEYCYLYLCRSSSAGIKYIMSRMFYFYVILLITLVTLFTSIAIMKSDKNGTEHFLRLIIQFYPLILPIIRNINGSAKTMKYCSKIAADIDNFFADGDDSIERLARFQYYVQNIEFEMLTMAPARYAIFPLVFKRGVRVLNAGVTKRFTAAIEELKKKALMAKGITIRTPKKSILTRTEIDLEALEKKERMLERKKAMATAEEEVVTPTPAPAPKPTPKPATATKPAAKTTTTKSATKTTKTAAPKTATVKVIRKPKK